MARQIAHLFARQRLTRPIARCIVQWMAADSSYFRLSTAFTMDCLPYCTVDGVADCSFVRSSTSFTTVCALYFSADGSGLLLLLLMNGFHNGLCAVFLSGWWRIAHTSARQRLSQRIARRIAPRMASDGS